MRSKTSVILILIIIFSLLITLKTKETTKTEYYTKQIEASEKVLEAFEVIKLKKIELGIEINKYSDPLQTGLIGEMTPLVGNSITTTLGALDAKQASTNPNFVALIIKYFKDLDLKKGDEVAVNFSSSFPALNIAIIIALDILELKSVIQTSIGSSTYGGNNIDFTYLDMEKYLFDESVIKRKTDLVSLGGERDVLYGIKLNDDLFIESLYERYKDYDQIKETNLKANVIYRYKYYNERLSDIKAYVNVGGNLVSHGAGVNTYTNGLIKFNTKRISKNSGLIDYFANDHVDIINLLNIKNLAQINNMEINTSVAYEIGIGNQYYITKYNKGLIITMLVIIFSIILYDLNEINNYELRKEVLFDEE